MPKIVTGDEIRLFILVSLGLMVVAGGVTALSVILSKPPEKTTLLPKQSPFKPGTSALRPAEILISDYILPREGGTWLTRPWYFSRKPGQPWSEEDVKSFWTDPAAFRLTDIPRENDRIIDELLDAVP